MVDVLVTRSLPGQATDRLSAAGLSVDQVGDCGLSRDALLSRVAGCRALLCQLSERVDLQLVDAAGSRLKIVSNYAVGTNNIDVDLCSQRRIWVGHTPDVLTEATADIAFSLLLAAGRRLCESSRLVRSGAAWNWAPDMLLGLDFVGKTLLIVGPGRIGVATARRAMGWNMNVLYVGRRKSPAMESLNARKIDLQAGLAQADFVSLHVPLTPQTQHLIGADELALMRPTAVLVNTARGPIIDEDALFAALQHRRIFAAGLDVHEHEPTVHPGLLTLDNVVLLPHIGSATIDTRSAMAHIAVDNILATLAGDRPPHSVNVVAPEEDPDGSPRTL